MFFYNIYCVTGAPQRVYVKGEVLCLRSTLPEAASAVRYSMKLQGSFSDFQTAIVRAAVKFQVAVMAATF